MSQHSITVVVIDDHSIFRSGLLQALRDAQDIEVVGEGANAADAMELCESLKPDVALLDLSMPGGGLSVARELSRRASATRSMILTASEDQEMVLEALEAGAAAYSLKDVSAHELADIIRSVAKGDTYVPPNLAARLIRSMRSEPDEGAALIGKLSPRERRIVRLMSQGFTNQEIAEATGSTVKTVKFHSSNIFQKLALRNRTEVALFAARYADRLE
ncbi:hypothetical protein ASE66_13750 [Bosea sp. Root483D1]|uniref:response regulator n=1 Tax=Bosea sp. Root483D1 TaxID=1736544 RepID=UPI0007092AF9|nr:response regulator transcription factor [Bosea sp. Root483D1]KRE14435.1 hypothetical protein ASE66_13750 [Bosea sp. Root483D1]